MGAKGKHLGHDMTFDDFNFYSLDLSVFHVYHLKDKTIAHKFNDIRLWRFKSDYGKQQLQGRMPPTAECATH